MALNYRKIDPSHPAFERVHVLLARGAFACDSVDHNENSGCSNPRCFKFKEEVAHDAKAGKASRDPEGKPKEDGNVCV